MIIKFDDMFLVKRLYKKYDKRVLLIKKNKKTIDRITPWWGWYCQSHRHNEETQTILRKLVIENLYWLLGQDCDKEEWENFIWRKHQGKLCGVCINDQPKSVFFSEEEYKTALNSINNK